MSPDFTVGWDIGGAHVKAALVASADGGAPRLVDVAQWPCLLWQGLDRLHAALAAARARWPQLVAAAGTRHAVTMTGEMVDLFEHREAGVRALADALVDGLTASLAPDLRFFRGPAGWCAPAAAGAHWAEIASANWWATASVAAHRLQAHGADADALLLDIGSTTTDLIAVRAGGVCAAGRSDAERLARGELFYQGVVRTPLCAIAPRIAHGGTRYNVMNEFFATSADVYRATGELPAEHDQQPTADGAPKDAAATRQRLARMIGLDGRDAPDAAWLAFAHAWRAAQLAGLQTEVERVVAAAQLGPRAPIIGAGCGDFLARALADATRRPYRRFESLWDVAPPTATGRPDAAALRGWLQVGAPAAAVAWLAASGWPHAPHAGDDVHAAHRPSEPQDPQDLQEPAAPHDPRLGSAR